MEDDMGSLLNDAPTPYPKNSDRESESRNTVLFLLNSTFVRGDIRILDKYPNFDGTLDLTDEKGTPLGQINVQVKTLPKKSKSNPGFSFDSAFMAACRGSLLPVILLIVDNENRKVYWRHIDNEVQTEFEQNRTGQT